VAQEQGNLEKSRRAVESVVLDKKKKDMGDEKKISNILEKGRAEVRVRT